MAVCRILQLCLVHQGRQGFLQLSGDQSWLWLVNHRTQKLCLGFFLNHVAVTWSLLTSTGAEDLAGPCSGRNTTVHRLSTRRAT